MQGFAKVIEGGGPKLFKPALDEGILVSCRKIFVTHPVSVFDWGARANPELGGLVCCWSSCTLS